MNKLRFLANLPIFVDNISIYSPTLRNIAEIGYEQYQLIISSLIISKEQLTESSLSDVKDNYDALLYIIRKVEGFESNFLNSLFFISKMNFVPHIQNGETYFVGDNVILFRNNYDSFVQSVKYSCNLNVEKIEELDEFDKQVLAMEKKIQEEQSKNIEQPSFEDLISAVANIDGNGLNIINIWDLNIYQFYEQLHRGQLKEQYRWNLKQLLAGAKPDDIHLESYFKNIK